MKSKSDRRQSKIINIAVAIFFAVLITAHGQTFLPALSNAVPTNIFALKKIEVDTNQSLPLIVMYDMPIRTGIENLARQANINYLLDTRLTKSWSSPDSADNNTHAPVLNFQSKNLTARQALLRVLGEHHLVLVENPLTSIARITYTNQAVNSVGFNSLADDTFLIPLIQFQDVPITAGLKNLARQAGINYTLDPKIGYGKPDKQGQIKAEPLLSFRWENVTAKQGFVAICENYDLVIVKDSETGGIVIKPKD